MDRKGGFIYYSFTNMLAKYDFKGRLIGTLTGWTGHLGDLDFNAADGRVYGSLEYGEKGAFYIAVMDGARIDRVGILARGNDILRTVYLPEVTRDHAAPGHRYGRSGIDGVAFGPAFGRTNGRRYLTVAYGIYGDNARTDNDHQVLLQYDVVRWARHARPLPENDPQPQGQVKPVTKVFVRTGNTRYGVQNLAYDDSLQRSFMGVYVGAKPTFPNYGLYAIDARSKPALGELVGVRHSIGAHWAKGLLLPLAPAGIEHRASGIRGWKQKADVGLQPLGGGLYFVVKNAKDEEGQRAITTLVRWEPGRPEPFRNAIDE